MGGWVLFLTAELNVEEDTVESRFIIGGGEANDEEELVEFDVFTEICANGFD